MNTNNNGAQPGPWHPSEAWAWAWAEMEGVLFRAIQGWRQLPEAVQIAPLLVGPLLITCRIEALAKRRPGQTTPAVEWRAGRKKVTRSEVVELIAQQIRAGHLPTEA